MKFIASNAWVLVLGLAAFSAAGDGLTSVTIDGQTYSQISDVHISRSGRITILYGLGGKTVRPEELPVGFLASWGITEKDLARAAQRTSSNSAATFLANQTALLFDQAVEQGLIRESDGIAFDLRKPAAGWEQFTRARMFGTALSGAVVDRTPDAASRDFVFVFNAPPPDTTGRASFLATNVGSVTAATQTIQAFDAGRACKREELPEAMIKQGLAQSELPNRAALIKAENGARNDALRELVAKLNDAKMQLEMEAEAAGPWLLSLPQAQSLAAKNNRLILLDFTGSDWCVWCKKMDADVFSTKQFSDYAEKYLVLVKADFPHDKPQPADLRAANEKLKAQYQVSGFPTLVAMKPDGTVVWKQSGYLEGGTVALLSKLDDAMK